MSFLGPSNLKSLLLRNNIIIDDNGINIYDSTKIEQAAYALSLGSEAYRTDNKDRRVEILDDKNKNIEINPGQFTLLMTDEYVNIPDDKLAFISIKAKQKLKGLVNVSGFHVDPGFKGKLLFSVYNAGPSTITLETKKPYFLIWFANLEDKAQGNQLYNTTNNHHQGQKSIPLDYIDALKRGEIASPNTLLQKINENKILIEAVSKSKELKNEKTFWIFSFILGLATTFNVAYWSRQSEYQNGYNHAIKEQLVNDIIKKGTTYSSDSLYLHRIDSLVNIKLKQKIDKSQ
ncbi:deoxycytidine triphosphate deaminase [Flavobacterium sp. CSZ]|uniref:dCTP deaminase domain-containing protein n=1 Tax=Flavobacterium sp. CSZ TaxID=2783791 RepID=UPI00188ADD4B|nr:deoxycytidine triphosphate deaminase [Flavobacterium sp. CSZ]MBF4487729.1 deoxycytidine triphosphate deaminase [Flavobacterium sp. CSZ]